MRHHDSHEAARTARLLGMALACAFVLLLGASLADAGFGSADGAGEWKLRIVNAACADGERVLLGDIARPHGMTDAEWAELAQKPLWKAPLHGRLQNITRKQLEKVLPRYIGELAASTVLPSRLTIQKGGRVYSATDLRVEVDKILTHHARLADAEVTYRDYNLPRYCFLPNAFDTLEISLDERQLVPGRNGLDFRIKTPDGRVTRRAAGSVFADVWKTVPVAAKPLNRMQRLSRANVTFARKNLAYYPNAWDGKQGDWRVSRSIGTGQPITMENIEPMPLVAKGDRVVLQYQSKTVTLAIKVEALKDGNHVGAKIPVRNLQSQKTIVATVTGKNAVAVQ